MFAADRQSTISISELLKPEAWPHSVADLSLLETHISWVILTGDFAYKIKKPVKFGFVDYSTPDKRRQYCHREVELNQRFAPDLYLGVVPILEIQGRLVMGDDRATSSRGGVTVGHAVKMRQFSQDAIVAARLQYPELSVESVEAFGGYLAKFHEAIPAVAPELPFVQPRQVVADALDNFPTIREILTGEEQDELLDRLHHWTTEQAARLLPKFHHRLHSGKIRLCHGDLHLKNVIQLDGQLKAFDGIEFNEEFQWIDVLSEMAFPVMDFVARGRADLAWRLLNAWLEQTGDYADLDVLRFYLVYRALVRAKVTLLNPKNRERAEDGSPNGPWDKYLKTAGRFAFDMQPGLAITHGFSGSGKSTVAMKQIDSGGGIRIRSDVERHRMADAQGAGVMDTGEKYSSEMNDRVYERLLELAIAIGDAGFRVYVDATFLRESWRQRFHLAAEKKCWNFEIVDCSAPFDELCERIRNRGPDPSEATVQVLKGQMESHDPLTEDERKLVRSVATNSGMT